MGRRMKGFKKTETDVVVAFVPMYKSALTK